MIELMNEHFFNNPLWLQAIYLVVICTVGLLAYLLFCQKKRSMTDSDLILMVTVRNGGDFKINLSLNEEMTIEIAEKLIDKLIVEASKKNPAVVRLLFTGSLKALTEDEQVGMLFKEITGNDLKDQFEK